MQNKNDNGMISSSYVLATGLSMVMLTWFMLFILTSYTRATIRSSAEQAVRAGTLEYNKSRNPSTAIRECSNTYNRSIRLSLNQEQTRKLNFICFIANNTMSITVKGQLPGIGKQFGIVTLNETSHRKLER